MLNKNIPVGIDNFSDLVDAENNFLFADKTDFIAKILDDKSKSILITRPRHWGKTLNFSMLEHFFAAEVNGYSTQGLFKGLRIEALKNGDYMKYQGHHPVISLTFKGLKPGNMEQAYQEFSCLLCKLFDHHGYLLDSTHLLPNDLLAIKRFSVGQPTLSDLKISLEILSRSLYRHTGQSVYILIDEYDTPVMHAYERDEAGKTEGFLEDWVTLMKSFLGGGLKGNDYLKKGVMSGILRVSYHEMLSDLNNLDNFSILNDDTFSSCYGFTEDEVKDIFERSGRFKTHQSLSKAMGVAKQYYNGYDIGGITLYNPWSIIHFLKKGRVAPYWVHTGSDTLIKRHVIQGGNDIKRNLADLLAGCAITKAITPYIRFDALRPGQGGFWTVLLYSGYLRVQSTEQNGLATDCHLVIPNREIYYLYRDILKN